MEYYTSKDLQKLFGVTKRTIINWKKSGKLTYTQIGNRFFYPIDQFKVRKEGEA